MLSDDCRGSAQGVGELLTAVRKCLRQATLAALWMAAPCVLADNTMPAPVRFALTFDDGPSADAQNNSTAIILDALAENPTQKGIKAIFFVLPRSNCGVATNRVRALLERERREGHVLALHDGSSVHRSHSKLGDRQLEESLRDGVASLMSIVGRPVTLLRPYWYYDQRTLAAYARHGLTMLLTDISANDGKTWGFHASPRRRSHMASELARVRQRMMRGEITAVEGVTPIVVAFHDTNDYTAAHMQEYLQMLVDEARAAGIALAARHFYDDGAALERAALARARDITHGPDMVPWPWRWIHRWFGNSPGFALHSRFTSLEPGCSEFG